jgi:hypothetical protein
MHKLFLIIFCACTITSFAQYNDGSVFYLGLQAGRGSLSGTESVVAGPNITADYAQFDLTYNPWAMTTVFSRHGTNKINLGWYLGATLGSGTTKYIYNYTAAPLNAEQQEFNLLVDLRFGLQLTHANDDLKYYVGIRYFNWYNGDGIRSYYTNADDGAAIGLLAGYKDFGIDLNFAPSNFPGVLVANELDYGQLELRYKSNITFGDDDYALIFGGRADISIINERETFNSGFQGYENAKGALYSLIIGFCGNND